MDERGQDEATHAFGLAYLGKVGTVEGGDDTPVEIVSVRLSCNQPADFLRLFDCEADQHALLAEWVPAGMTYSRPSPGQRPEEEGVDPRNIPDLTEWALFPAEFEGLPVFYRRGHGFFAD